MTVPPVSPCQVNVRPGSSGTTTGLSFVSFSGVYVVPLMVTEPSHGPSVMFALAGAAVRPSSASMPAAIAGLVQRWCIGQPPPGRWGEPYGHRRYESRETDQAPIALRTAPT